ncbi:threo-3-hydroxy-L-aspartate ammonia-lyase [Acidovorax sp. SUPP950]|uniref:threo-3-hydroxy-L-aspartate ammonia-lyase n=1 Tax=unclassified Acidovorax TaxID=2684926 RepID=UPI0023BF791D|nr:MULTISPECIES: threo-3-hydroxy-L-aspartate ammonia-lyase [unclassified Acidovorax]GKS76774.1 threo-3-hydroxy-L-aspartate ammonia-lyase [Acidovorax sp. SUPP950]GKS95903.1 threo-3-hydroxy-L-aspartate ammonia-lyase [Acidovorax sp. SUPP2825]
MPTHIPALPTYTDVADAAHRLQGVAHRTPVARSSTADQQCGAQLFFKCENLQRMGAFKFRGAYNTLAQFDATQREGGVLAFSSGNHAQAIALSARLLDMPALIVMPEDAPTAKMAATREYGAQVVTYNRFTEDREAISHRLAQERGMTLVPPFDHPHVIAGQGTAAKELLEEVPDLDYLFVCLGGGGLLSGSLLAAKALAPDCQVIGVEPAAGNDAQQSLRAGRIVRIDTPHTIADGAQTQALGSITFPIIQRDVADIVTATDEQLVQALRFFAERMKIVVEPTGALAFAGALHGGVDLHGKRVGIIVSGGNVDLARYARFLAD